MSMQAVKRLAELAVDLTRDVTRLHATVAAFGRLSRATEPHEVEQTLIECLVEPLGLSSARMYLVNSARKTASSMSGPAVITSWRPQAMEQNPSLVAWCVFMIHAAYVWLHASLFAIVVNQERGKRCKTGVMIDLWS